MSQSNLKCFKCGGVEFTIDAGSFFCLECNTQTQDVREEVFDDYFGAQKAVSRVLVKKSVSKAKTSGTGLNVKLTSWELLNYVLKGITCELIELGAKQELKTVVLQLWASYLRNLEVAFTSVDVERKPKLGYAFKKSDAEIVYGVTSKQLKEKTWRSRTPSNVSKASSSSSQSSMSSGGETLTRRSALKKLSIRKKALASVEYSQQLTQSTLAACSQTLEHLDSSSELGVEKPKRLKITRHAKAVLNSSGASSTEDESIVRRRILKKEIKSTRNVTTAKVVAIVNIALALTHQQIQLSDFIRWVEEGHISLRTSKKFLPNNTKLTGDIEKFLELEHMSYMKCQTLMSAMCSELDIDSLPTPDLCGLAERYCTELQLPVELTEMVQRLLTIMLGISRMKQDRILTWKSGELLAMAAVVFIIKLLFSLDDCTEHQISQTASVLNRLYEEEGESTRLFSWTEWVCYIECRKAVVAAHHLPTKTAVYGNTVPHDPLLFVQHTAEQRVDHKEVGKIYMLNKEWVDVLSRCLSKLSKDSAKVSSPVVFPASLTPLHSCVGVLLSQHAERVAPAARVLRQDFTSHSLLHVTSPEQCLAYGLVNDLNIIQKPVPATTYKVEKIKIREKDPLTIPRYKINHVNTSVIIAKSSNIGTTHEAQSTSDNINKSDKFLEIISDESDDDDEEENVDNDLSDKSQVVETDSSDSPLELFVTGSQYWCCHVSLTKHSTTNEEFELLAMRTFPFAFLWLLKECSRIISVHSKELYSYLVVIEKEHKYISEKLEYLLRHKNFKRKSRF